MFSGAAIQEGWRERRRQRFPIRAAARLIIKGSSSEAVIYNISSRGALFEAGMILPRGKELQLVVDWPVLLDDRVPLRLVLFGRVVRSNETGTAIVFLRHEWKIGRRHPEREG